MVEMFYGRKFECIYDNDKTRYCFMVEMFYGRKFECIYDNDKTPANITSL
jgi:hypothetical protein